MSPWVLWLMWIAAALWCVWAVGQERERGSQNFFAGLYGGVLLVAAVLIMVYV